MIKDDWESLDGNSSKARVLAMIENLDIVVIAQMLDKYKRNASKLEDYVQDRKREIRNLSKPEKLDFLQKMMTGGVFTTKRLPKEKEEEMSQIAYEWYKLKDDKDVIDALESRIDELQYNKSNDEERATVVSFVTNIINTIPDEKQWQNVYNKVLNLISEFDFMDLMMFKESCGNYYVFTKKGMDEVLRKLIPNLKEEEMCHYSYTMCDGGEKDATELIELKKKRILELKMSSNFFYDLEIKTGDISKLKAIEKVEYVQSLKKAEYKEYIEFLKKLSPIEVVQYLSINVDSIGNIYKEEAELIQQKLKNVSRQGKLTILVSALKKGNGKYQFSDLFKENKTLVDFFVKEGLLKEDEINANSEEIEKAKKISNAYKMLPDIRIRNSSYFIREDLIDKDATYDEEAVKEKYIQVYKNERNEFEKELEFIKDCINLDTHTKDFQIVNIINHLNNNSSHNAHKEITNQEQFMANYFKNRILAMDKELVKKLKVCKNGIFNEYIEVAQEQQAFAINRDFDYDDDDDLDL